MVTYNRQSARRSIFDTVIYRAVSQVATVLGYIVMVRGMTKEDFGVYNLLYAFIPALGTLASLGLEQTLRRYQPEYLNSGNYVAATWLVRFVSSVRFGTTVIAIALVLLAWNWVAPIFQMQPYRLQFMAFSGLMLLHFQVSILQLSLASRMLHRLSVGSMALLAYGKLFAYSAFVYWDSLTLVNAIIADTVAYGLAYTSLKLLYNKNVHPGETATGSPPSPEEKKRMVRYGFYNNFNDAGSLILNTKSDSFFIAAFIDPVSVGIYSFYNRLVEMASQLLPGRLFQNVIQPLFFAIDRSRADEKIPRYFSLLLNVNFIIQVPILAYSLVYHEQIVTTLFGTKFQAYSSLLPLMFFFAAINLISVPATLVAQYEEKSSIILLSKVLAIYNVVAQVILVPFAGVFGAAIASGSAQFFKNAFIWWFVRDKARWLNFRGVLTSSLLIWSIAMGICYALLRFVHVPAIVQLIFGGIVCAVAGLLYLRSAALSASDRDLLGGLMHGKETKILRLIGISAKSGAKPAATS